MGRYFLWFLACFFFFSSHVFAMEMIPLPTPGAYFGVLSSNDNGTINDKATTDLVTLINKPIAIKMVGAGDKSSLADLDAKMAILETDYQEFHTVPMLHIGAKIRTLKEIATNTINPNDHRTDSAGEQVLPVDFYRHYARGLKAYGKPVLVRIFSEMNWNAANAPEEATYRICDQCKDIDTGEVQTPAVFIAAWRRIHNIFVTEGATNVMFMFIAVPHYSGCYVTSDYVPLYPGSAYVDWIGWDVYNFNSRCGWASFSRLLDADYQKMRAYGKPFIIPEFNTIPGTPGQRGDWYKEMLTSLPMKYPKIKVINFFDVASEIWGTTRLQSLRDDPNAAAQFKDAIASVYYHSSVPSTAIVPGDLTETGNKEGDNVNIFDYNYLVQHYGNPYTIFDYNKLVSNYEK